MGGSGVRARHDGRNGCKHDRRAQDKPVYELLGGKRRGEVAILWLLGTGMLISADANQGFSVEAAIDYVRAVERKNLDFLE